MQTQVVHSTNPVFVSLTSTGKAIEVRIGESKPGVSRLAFLTPKEARAVAIALLQVAEAMEQDG